MTNSRRFTVTQRMEFWLALVLSMFTAISIRMAEYPLWNDSVYVVHGERLMATHDAYAWLAAAKGIGGYTGHAFTKLLALIHHATGLELSSLGFWSPIMLVPLLAVPACFLARNISRPEGGLVFGILATSGIGFLVRTRLGFCDTDLIALFFPLAVSCSLAVWLSDIRDKPVGEVFLDQRELVGISVTGLLGLLGTYMYPGNISLLFSTYILGVVLVFLVIPAARREAAGWGVLFAFAASFTGWPGTLIVCGWCAWRLYGNVQERTAVRVLTWSVMIIAVLLLADAHEKVWWIVQRLFFYAKSSAPDLANATASIRLPDIAQSVREAQNLDWGQLGPRMGGNWVVFILGLLGFVFVSWRRPVLLIFLPYLVLGLASMKLGNRFAMFGTVGIGMGLGLGLSELMAMLNQSQGRRWIVQLSVACLALWPSAQFMGKVSPVPVLPKVYAETFLELRERSEPDAMLWQWWDYGYAAQYYAERATMGDGGRQSGPWLYPLAQVHCASSATAARRMMQYFGHVVRMEGMKSSSDPLIVLLAGNPVTDLMDMGGAQAGKFMQEIVSSDQDWPQAPPQYLTFSWENLRLAGWIGYYGNWDIVTGTSSPGNMQRLQGEVRIDSAAGSLMVKGQPVPIDTLDIVEEKGTRHFEWPNGSGAHVLINQAARQVFLMDSKMYRSMMVQMLIAPPENFADDFTLVVDKYPWVRAYKVKD